MDSLASSFPEEARRDVSYALRNALKLGVSLLFTWGIALSVRFVLPRWLGPHLFGALSFSDGFSGMAMVFLSLGLDSYARLTLPVRPSHASEFFGGITLFRILIGALLCAAIAVALHLTHRPPEVRSLVWIFAAAHFFVQLNFTLTSFLHSCGRVDGMSVLAVVTKIIWGAGVFLAMFTGAGLWAYPASLLASEATESVVLLWLCRRHLSLDMMRVEWEPTLEALRGSMPFFAFSLVHNVYARVDVSILGVITNDREVGYYGAAQALGSLSLLLAPLLGWVLTPLLARAAARSPHELDIIARRALELVVVASAGLLLVFWVGAAQLIHLVFGDAFAPATSALRVISIGQLVTYVAMILSSVMGVLDRRWALTIITAIGAIINAALNVICIGPLHAWLGDGGGGTACALVTLATESLATGAMIVLLGRRIADPRTFATLLRVTIAFIGSFLLDRLLGGFGLLRLVTDGFVFLLLAVLFGAVRTSELVWLVRASWTRRMEAS